MKLELSLAQKQFYNDGARDSKTFALSSFLGIIKSNVGDNDFVITLCDTGLQYISR